MVDETNVRGMVDIGYAATTIGSYDLYMGVDYLKSKLMTGEVPVVSANVFDESSGELLVEPYVVVAPAGVRFAVTGVLDPAIDLRTHRDIESAGVTIGDPYDALTELVPELREKADYVVLLSHTGLPRAKDIVAAVSGIDFLIVGNHSAYSAEAYEVDGVVFIQPGYKGQYLSDYRLDFGEDGAYTGYTGRTFALGENVPSDAAMALMLKEHKVGVEEFTKAQAAEKAKEREAQAKATQSYAEACIGANDSCKRCHASQFDQWMTTAHASAFETLEESHQATNPACLRCHATCALELPLDGSGTVLPELRSVQCESCHGMGTDHARDGSYGAVAATSCLRCHDQENSPDFDFATYAAKVAH